MLSHKHVGAVDEFAETLSEPIAGVTSAAVLGAGLIGASMAAMFATAGVSVKLWDPRPESEPEFRRRLAIAQDQLEQLGRAPRSKLSRLARWLKPYLVFNGFRERS